MPQNDRVADIRACRSSELSGVSEERHQLAANSEVGRGHSVEPIGLEGDKG
jgi:hypothetical protein